MTYEEIIEQEPQPMVYSIDFPNGMFYVGRTVDISRRAKRHFHESMRSAHPNTAMERCFKKYKFQEIWGVIKRFSSAKEAVEFESMYIDEFWDDPLFLNQKRGGYAPVPSGLGGKLAYGRTPEECEADAERILSRDFARLCNEIDPKEKVLTQKQKDYYRELNAQRKEERRIAKLKKSYVVKDLKTGRVSIAKWWSRKQGLTPGQKRVLNEGVRPWSLHNVRRYGEPWAEFVPMKIQSWADHNKPKPITGTHKNGEKRDWSSVGSFVREQLNPETNKRKKQLRKYASKAVKRNGTFHGWKLKYKHQ
jgi:predicted GIY-YIG superfamily endonuclease